MDRLLALIFIALALTSCGDERDLRTGGERFCTMEARSAFSVRVNNATPAVELMVRRFKLDGTAEEIVLRPGQVPWENSEKMKECRDDRACKPIPEIHGTCTGFPDEGCYDVVTRTLSYSSFEVLDHELILSAVATSRVLSRKQISIARDGCHPIHETHTFTLR